MYNPRMNLQAPEAILKMGFMRETKHSIWTDAKTSLLLENQMDQPIVIDSV
jgi:hypothetical protein